MAFLGIYQVMNEIWQREFTLEYLNQLCSDCMISALGISFTEKGSDYLCATMPVNEHTRQPFGLLHGGASVVLAESLASVAGNMVVNRDCSVLGLEINANHLRAVKKGIVTAKATLLHKGASTQVWSVEIRDDTNHLSCVVRTTLAVRRKMKISVDK